MFFVFALLAIEGTSPAAPPSAAVSIPFRTDATPRIDAVVGDAVSLRAALDGFSALQDQMDGVRERFSTAVHDTLATLPNTSIVATKAPHACPPAAAEPYTRALTAGGRFLSLGQQLAARYREIRRGEESGDAAGLTPDYRWKVRRAREQYGRLLADYREMRVAFHDQLGAELRHNGCKLGDKAPRRMGAEAPRPSPAPAPLVADDDGGLSPMNPNDPAAWTLDAFDEPLSDPARPPPLGSAGDGATAAVVATTANKPPPSAGISAGTATAIWIDVDNSLCPQTTHITIDGQPMGDVSGRGTASIRTRAGPHELCVLPATDARACGTAGTVRKAYLHEGWSLIVHCGR